MTKAYFFPENVCVFLGAARLALDSAVGIDLVLMLDRSSSISPADFNKGIEFCKFILDQFGMNNVTGMYLKIISTIFIPNS